MKTSAEIAALVAGVLDGDPHVSVRGVATLSQAQEGDLSFFGSARYRAALENSKASVVLVPQSHPPPEGSATYIRVDDPRRAFAEALLAFHPPVPPPSSGISPRANVAVDAVVHPTASVMANATVGARAHIQAGCVLYPGTYVGADAQVGEGSVLRPNAVVMDGCSVGARCLLHPGAVVGADGFGFSTDKATGTHQKIPQVGVARIGDDVEIGACSCVDRATIGETIVGNGTKIDNLVQVGHNSIVGPNALICAQAGIAGSVVLGSRVVLAGQAGVSGHLRVGDGAVVGPQAGVVRTLDPGAEVIGTPAIAQSAFWRAAAALKRFPGLLRRVAAIERKLGVNPGKDE